MYQESAIEWLVINIFAFRVLLYFPTFWIWTCIIFIMRLKILFKTKALFLPSICLWGSPINWGGRIALQAFSGGDREGNRDRDIVWGFITCNTFNPLGYCIIKHKNFFLMIPSIVLYKSQTFLDKGQDKREKKSMAYSVCLFTLSTRKMNTLVL